MNDEAFTLYTAPVEKRRGKFKDGNIPWNRGKTWKGISIYLHKT